ncbi:hypothetical protein [Streptomyces sp. NPDC046909]|uniref:hypothetical protein n=1 Tax=Streptomyces sp. NPDC046909 TaxID=3155617 RepID=UPI0033F4C88C
MSIPKDDGAPANSPATKQQLDDKSTEIVNAIKKGPETDKNLFESLFEALGLKDLFSAIKDGENWGSKLLLAFGALAALLLGKLLDFGKIFNAGLEKVTRALLNVGRPNDQPQRTGRVLAIGENGLPQQMTRVQMDSLNSVSINPHGLTGELIAELNSALSGISPKIREFNSATADMKSASAIKKIAKAIGDLKNKLTPSPKEAITDVATAIGTLDTTLNTFSDSKLPKAQTLRDIAKAADAVQRNASGLKKLFEELAAASTRTADSLTG